jgi:predicted  nucleic acid-binding Zn-ribbon protein
MNEDRKAFEQAKHELLAAEAEHSRLADALNLAERTFAAHELPLAAARRKVRQARSKIDIAGAAVTAEIAALKQQLAALTEGEKP